MLRVLFICQAFVGLIQFCIGIGGNAKWSYAAFSRFTPSIAAGFMFMVTSVIAWYEYTKACDQPPEAEPRKKKQVNLISSSYLGMPKATPTGDFRGLCIFLLIAYIFQLLGYFWCLLVYRGAATCCCFKGDTIESQAYADAQNRFHSKVLSSFKKNKAVNRTGHPDVQMEAARVDYVRDQSLTQLEYGAEQLQQYDQQGYPTLEYPPVQGHSTLRQFAPPRNAEEYYRRNQAYPGNLQSSMTTLDRRSQEAPPPYHEDMDGYATGDYRMDTAQRTHRAAQRYPESTGSVRSMPRHQRPQVPADDYYRQSMMDEHSYVRAQQQQQELEQQQQARKEPEPVYARPMPKQTSQHSLTPNQQQHQQPQNRLSYTTTSPQQQMQQQQTYTQRANQHAAYGTSQQQLEQHTPPSRFVSPQQQQLSTDPRDFEKIQGSDPRRLEPPSKVRNSRIGQPQQQQQPDSLPRSAAELHRPDVTPDWTALNQGYEEEHMTPRDDPRYSRSRTDDIQSANQTPGYQIRDPFYQRGVEQPRGMSTPPERDSSDHPRSIDHSRSGRRDDNREDGREYNSQPGLYNVRPGHDV